MMYPPPPPQNAAHRRRRTVSWWLCRVYDDEYVRKSRFCTHELAINRAFVFDPSMLLSSTGTASSCSGFNQIFHGIESRTLSTHTENAYHKKKIFKKRQNLSKKMLITPPTPCCFHTMTLAHLRNCWKKESCRNLHGWSSVFYIMTHCAISQSFWLAEEPDD